MENGRNDRQTVVLPRLGEFELVLALAIEALAEEAYGASLAREIEEHTQRNVSLGAIYKTLERMERKRLIDGEIGDPRNERGGRRRKNYTLTARGMQCVRRSLADLDSLRRSAGLSEWGAEGSAR